MMTTCPRPGDSRLEMGVSLRAVGLRCVFFTISCVEEYTDESKETLLGHLEYPLLHTLRFDNNGFATRIGQPTDISDWDTDEFSKVSYWGKLVHGVTNSIYPQNYAHLHRNTKPLSRDCSPRELG